jgi:quercetin dioxygenase-like cupin family protein
METIKLLDLANRLPSAWKSTVVGRPAGVNLKVLRMDGSVYPDEVHDFDEALLVLEGCMRLDMQGKVTEVHAGQVCIVPAGVPHGVAAGSHGTLIIIDP